MLVKGATGINRYARKPFYSSIVNYIGFLFFPGPNITLEADGEVYCQNYGTACGEIPSKDHAITCRVKNLESDRPTMTLKVNGDIISSGPPDVTTNSHRYYDGVITASYNVPDDANSTCEVTDTRGTYDIASLPGKFRFPYVYR